MRVITEHAKTYPEDPSRHFDFARFTNHTDADFTFFAGMFDFKALDALPKDQHVVYLELEEPNRFFVPVPEFHHLSWDERFSKVFTLCPYTAAWLNSRHLTDRWTPAFYPFNERHAPPECAKEFDVIYTGGAHGPGIEQLIQEARAFNYRFVSQTPHPAVTNANSSYSEKLSLISRSKVTIVHNLLFATRQHVEQVWRSPEWHDNVAFARLPEPGSAEWLSAPAGQFWLAPQLKSRLFEAAFSRSLILCQRDPWNLIERYFEPETEFVYFESGSLGVTLRKILADFPRYERVIARAYERAMRDYTTTSFFEKFLRPLDYAPHSRNEAGPQGNSESANSVELNNTRPLELPTTAEIPAVSTSAAERLLPLRRVKSTTGPLDSAFLVELAGMFGLRAFVETDTFLGNTTAVASDIFPEVHTIELSPDLAAKARSRFATNSKIHVHQGDSAELLAQILAQLSAPALFWLDGHYSEGITARGPGNTPILDEIAAIARSGRKDAVILIDDLRLFERRRLPVDEESSLHGYPTMAELHAAVREIDPDYQCFVYGDVALAFPATASVNVSPLIMAMTISRMFDGGNLPVDEVVSAETLIAQAEGTEREAICELPLLSASTEQHGLGLHYRLWHGHILLGQGNFMAAKHEFSEILRLGFGHWRAHWYLALAAHGMGDHNFARSILDALVEAVPDFAPALELRQKLPPPAAPAPAPATAAPAPAGSKSIRPMLQAGRDSLAQLVAAGVYRAGRPLRLHLGCGEQHFDEYVNIDYPPSEHSCQTRIGADVFADVTKLSFPPESVDEIRLHHVFEHFKRSEALALLIRWHEMLKVGGRLHLETPDLDGCARQLVSDLPLRVKQVVIRHCFGSQEAGWANHYDGWTAERYHHVLGQLGFRVQTKNWQWPHPPHLANVEAMATKTRNLSRAELLAVADQILSEYMTVDVPSERGMCEVWRKAMRDFLAANEPAQTGEVTVKLQGGLGNQMFQFAASLALARRHNAQLKLDLSFLRDRTPRPNFTQRDYCLDLFQLPADCAVVPDSSADARRLRSHVEQQFHFDPKFFELGSNVYLDGYFQSPRFFEPVRDEVMRTFKSFTTPLNAEQRTLAEKIRACPAVCLNVRRGDYVANPETNQFHGVCDVSYFHRSIAEIQRHAPDAHVFIFSDDIEWCRTANLTNGAPFTMVSHDFAGDRFGAYLQLMMACRHFILPNSSFGWWAAFLGTAPDKIVIAPTPWFDNPTNNTVDLLPATWIQLPKNNAAGPLVSVVISCHNYANYLPEAVASVRNQTYRNLEIIVVDDGSTDESPSVAKQLAAAASDIPIRIFRLDDVGPAASRRFGVAQARGKYYLPLDADDRIAPEFLAKTVPQLESDAKLGFAYVDTVFFGDKQQRHHQSEYDFARLCQGNFISHTSLIRKAAFEAVGGYDPENWGYYEDWDLWLRLGSKGWFGKHVGEPLFFYRHHFNSSLSLFACRLDPVYKAFLQSRHPEIYPETVIASAGQILAEMPPGWNRRPPMRDVGQLKTLLAEHPRNRHVLYFLGCAWLKSGAREEAGTVFKNLLNMYPDDTQAQEVLKQLTAPTAAPTQTSQTPLVSVIVPTYNRPAWLGETLQSILAQTYREFEIIVVNDAGPDVSHIIEPLNGDGRIRLVTHEKNKGLAGARNTGIRAARGQYIAYLDDDDIYYPQHLATLMAHAQATGADVVYADANRATQRKEGAGYVVVERAVTYSQDWDADKILVHNFIPVLCFLHKRHCVEQAGWFDESLTTHEDWDLWMRMSRLFRFSHLKEVTSEFRWRDDGSSMSSERQADFVRTANIIYHKHPEFIKNRPELLARRQQFLRELAGPIIFNSGKPAPGRLPVSIIIPVFNKVEFTRKCLARLAAIPCSVPHEIIVVDDHSTDETEAFCLAQLKVQPNLRYHRLPENHGFGGACNHGAAQARGHWLVFLNNDTEPEAGWLEAAVARFESDPSIGIVGARLLYPDRTVQHCGIEFFWADNPDHKIWPLHRHLGVAEQAPEANTADQMAAVTGACLFIPASLFHCLGGFSPEYQMYFEDTDLCFKSWQAGRKVFYEPQCVVVHHESQSSPNRERVDALNKTSGDIFFKKWQAQLDRIAFDTCLEKSEGRFNYFRQQVLPLPPNGRVEAKWLEEVAKTLVKLFHHVGPFYMHFGGAGDALLLLATFLDKHPDAQVISFPNSIPAARSFFEAFPSLKRVWFLPKNQLPQIHIILRMMMRHCPECLGMGTTPEGDYFKDWHAGLDIFQQYGVSQNPGWVCRFQTQLRPKQIVLAPKGSLCGMVGSKRNIIDPAVWPQLIRFIQKAGYQPVIIGTPDEKKDYPCVDSCEDRRSYSFGEQMAHIANSAMLVGADSWAKTFSALAGVRTIVFEPIRGADWTNKKDPSDFIFLDPWKNITSVKNFEQFRNVFAGIVEGGQPHQTSQNPASAPLHVSWEGSFLDHGSLSHVNRELTGALKNFPGAQIKCVTNGGPVAADAATVWPQLAGEISAKPAADAAITVRHAWPPNWKRPTHGKLVVIQPWEFGSLPEAWVKQACDVDEFWIPSEYVRRVYVESGVPAAKVVVVPNGVDAEKFHPQAAPMKLATAKKFKFLFVGGTIGRKGPDVLLQAYLRNFTAADDVCLVIKDFGGKSVYNGQTFETQIRAMQSAPNAPELLYLNEEWPPEQLPGLYTACDCFVMPYRGEGFGLPVLEAMACGLPVIVTAGGATDDFVTDEFAWRIPATKRNLSQEISGMKLVANGWMLEPDQTALGKWMRRAFENPAQTRARGALASHHAHGNFSWKKAAAIAAQRIQALGVQSVRPAAAKAKVVSIPAVAKIGRLDEARALLAQKDYAGAWTETATAIAKRPFHPEAFLLLAEIALAAGDGKSAKVCAQHARQLAPGWLAPKQLLKKAESEKRKTETTPAWFDVSRITHHASRLSVCLIVKNEEKFLAQCLKSVRDLAAQIVVVDTGSADRTVEIAREFGAEIYSFAWCDDFAAARNAALEHATGDWILMLDADEELPAAQHAKLQSDMTNATTVAFRLPLVNAGQENEGRSFVPRLFRNVPGAFFTGRIHEQVFSSLIEQSKNWGLKTTLGTAEILHHGYAKEMVRDRNKVERNLKLLRAAIEENPADVNLLMNFGLELVRSDNLAAGVDKYREAFELMSTQPAADVVPELREVLLTQFTSQLYKIRAHAEAARVLTSPLAKRGGLTASLHFALGLAHFELKQFSEAADQMRQCLNKRKQSWLTPINTDILTAAPQHCLALCLAKLNDTAGAEKAFVAALAEAGHVEAATLDFAKFLRAQNRAVDALHRLHEIISTNPRQFAAWQLGGEITLSQPDFLEVARDWTGEALQALPENPVVAAQCAESLMLNGDATAAAALWEKLWRSEPEPRTLSALILCEVVSGKTAHAPGASDEQATSLAFVEWYQKLLAMRVQPLADKINASLTPLAQALPSAARMLETALSEAAMPAY